MAIAAVNDWLNAPVEFRTGVALLKEHGKPSKALSDLLALGPTGYSERKLREALERINAIAPETAKAEPTPTPTSKDPRTDTTGWSSSMVALYEEYKSMYKEKDALRHQLDFLPTDEERLEASLRILDLREMIERAHLRIDTYRNTGVDPEEDNALEEERKAWRQKLWDLKNLPQYISKFKNKEGFEDKVADARARLESARAEAKKISE